MTKDELLKIRIQSAKLEIKFCDFEIKEKLDYLEIASNTLAGVVLRKKGNKAFEWNEEIKSALKEVDDLSNQHTVLTKKLTLLTEKQE